MEPENVHEKLDILTYIDFYTDISYMTIISDTLNSPKVPNKSCFVDSFLFIKKK